MDILIQIYLMVIMLTFHKGGLNTYTFLILLQSISFFLQFLVGYDNEIETITQLFHITFITLNTFLIIAPWRFSKIKAITFDNKRYYQIFKKWLYIILRFNFVINLFILIVVYIYIPDIASFKSESAYKKLYDEIPYFANIFRYAYVSQNLGYLAIPLFFHYLSIDDYRRAKWAAILSSSSLLSGFAFYSRAQILTFVLVFVVFFLLTRDSLGRRIKDKLWGSLKKFTIVISVLFVLITFLRFSAMEYYGERIPKTSVIKNPVVYSLVDYASQSYPKGLARLEDYTPEKNLAGQDMFRSIYQFLGFFGIISWDGDVADEQIAKAFNYDGGAFKGYTAQMVYNFGYFLTFLISFVYYLIVRKYLRNKTEIPIESLFILVMLLFIPVVSIFYSGYGDLYFPLIFIFFTRILYKFVSPN